MGCLTLHQSSSRPYQSRIYVLADARSIARMIRFVILVTSSANAKVLHAMTHVSARIATTSHWNSPTLLDNLGEPSPYS